jgi:hypothetical protein
VMGVTAIRVHNLIGGRAGRQGPLDAPL